MMTSQEALDYFLNNAHPYLKKLKEFADSRGLKILADPNEQIAYMGNGNVMIAWRMIDARPENGGKFRILAPIKAIASLMSSMAPSEINDFLENQVITLSHEIGHFIDYGKRETTDGRNYCGVCDHAMTGPCLLKEIRASYNARTEILPEIVEAADLPRFIEMLKNFSREYFSSEYYDFCRHSMAKESCKEACDKETQALFE